METTKVIKSFSELSELLNANANLYTYDYTEGCQSSKSYKEAIDIDIDQPDPDTLRIIYYSGTLIIFQDQSQLHTFIQEESANFDPTAGSDDQYYDYNPSQLEAILGALPFASQETIEQAKQTLLPKLDAFIQDEDQDEDMITRYQSYRDSLTSGNYTDNLELTAMLNDMQSTL